MKLTLEFKPGTEPPEESIEVCLFTPEDKELRHAWYLKIAKRFEFEDETRLHPTTPGLLWAPWPIAGDLV